MALISYEDFQEDVKKRITEKLTAEERVRFAWLCAIRVLPFIVSENCSFYWREEFRDNHLYSIIKALNFSYPPYSESFPAVSAGYSPYATSPYDAYASASAIASPSARAAANASASAADASASLYAASTSASAYVYAVAADAAPTHAASFAYAAYDAYASTSALTRTNIEIILQDIQLIQQHGSEQQFPNYVEIFGEVWDNLFKALRAIGCGYWADEYKKIFDNGFVIDEDTSKLWISVPDEIEAQGAAVVANYLQNVKKRGVNCAPQEKRSFISGSAGTGKTKQIEELNGKPAFPPAGNATTIATTEVNSMYFVSYSWKNSEPDPKVLSMVNNLREHGYNVTCDVMYLQRETSPNFYEMMVKEMSRAEKVIVVLSPQYKEKADNFEGGVGTEYRYILDDINRKKEKYILVNFEGDVRDEIIPTALRGRELIPILKSPNNRYTKLFHKLTGVPEHEFSDVNPIRTLVHPKIISSHTPMDGDEITPISVGLINTHFPNSDYRISDMEFRMLEIFNRFIWEYSIVAFVQANPESGLRYSCVEPVDGFIETIKEDILTQFITSQKSKLYIDIKSFVFKISQYFEFLANNMHPSASSSDILTFQRFVSQSDSTICIETIESFKSEINSLYQEITGLSLFI